MSEDNDLGDLIQITERLEIRARDCNRKLRHVREIIQRQQSRETILGSRDSIFTASSEISFATREEPRQVTLIAVPVTSR